HIQHRCLAGAVRPDDREDLMPAHLEADVIERGDPAKSEPDPISAEDRLADPFRVQLAFLNASGSGGGKVLAASPIASSARREPWRLSSNVISVSMRPVERPEYSASTSGRYRSATILRRTLRVRVNSPSSASSSFGRIRKRRICAAPRAGSAARSPFT